MYKNVLCISYHQQFFIFLSSTLLAIVFLMTFLSAALPFFSLARWNILERKIKMGKGWRCWVGGNELDGDGCRTERKEIKCAINAWVECGVWNGVRLWLNVAVDVKRKLKSMPACGMKNDSSNVFTRQLLVNIIRYHYKETSLISPRTNKYCAPPENLPLREIAARKQKPEAFHFHALKVLILFQQASDPHQLYFI